MKAKSIQGRTVALNSHRESLFELVQSMEPEFSDEAEARRFYSQRLEQIAARRKLSIEGMLAAIEDSSQWSTEDREVLRMSQLISALSSK